MLLGGEAALFVERGGRSPGSRLREPGRGVAAAGARGAVSASSSVAEPSASAVERFDGEPVTVETVVRCRCSWRPVSSPARAARCCAFPAGGRMIDRAPITAWRKVRRPDGPRQSRTPRRPEHDDQELEPEKAADSGAAGDRENDQGDDENPKQWHSGLLRERTRLTTKRAGASSKRTRKALGYAGPLSSAARPCRVAPSISRRCGVLFHTTWEFTDTGEAAIQRNLAFFSQWQPLRRLRIHVASGAVRTLGAALRSSRSTTRRRLIARATRPCLRRALRFQHHPDPPDREGVVGNRREKPPPPEHPWQRL